MGNPVASERHYALPPERDFAPSPIDDPASSEALPGLVGRSPIVTHLADTVRRFARVRLPALIRGESGVGKDLVARALHALGPRSDGPFVAINAATISKELAESELFGHVRGAFTGATNDRRGAFREAHGGSLFIDEIGALGLDVQAKLLRVVEDGLAAPVGGDTPVRVDVRVIAATCDPLERMVEDRRFRADLYERIAVCVVSVPPLRQRTEDIPLIARALVRSAGLDVAISEGAFEALQRHRYRGNVRELRNVLVQCALLSRTRTIEASDVDAVLASRGTLPARFSLADARALVARCNGSVARAARLAGMPRSTLRDLLRRAGPPPPPSTTENVAAG